LAKKLKGWTLLLRAHRCSRSVDHCGKFGGWQEFGVWVVQLRQQLSYGSVSCCIIGVSDQQANATTNFSNRWFALCCKVNAYPILSLKHPPYPRKQILSISSTLTFGAQNLVAI
jgi:hypothetical protein